MKCVLVWAMVVDRDELLLPVTMAYCDDGLSREVEKRVYQKVFAQKVMNWSSHC